MLDGVTVAHLIIPTCQSPCVVSLGSQWQSTPAVYVRCVCVSFYFLIKRQHTVDHSHMSVSISCQPWLTVAALDHSHMSVSISVSGHPRQSLSRSIVSSGRKFMEF